MNTTNNQFKKHIIDFEEFKEQGSETSNYDVPYSAVIPPPNDKIWNYVKKNFKKMPNWGHKFKDQEDVNKVKGDRDGETKNKPHDSAVK